MKVVEVKGLKFEVRPGTSDEKAVTEVVQDGCYKRRYFQVEAGERWLDLGANIGAFACLAAQQDAQVEAYEPEPENAALARSNLMLNGYVATVHEAAVVADTETRDHLNFYLSNTSYGNWRHSLYKTKNKRCIQVPVLRISPLLEKADAVKMDIEGAEIDILLSLRDYGNVKKLCFEYHFDVNNSIPIFMEVINRLKHTFTEVRYNKMPEGVERYTFYPPARIVFCWR
jgi:FkbM family methyltransferase